MKVRCSWVVLFVDFVLASAFLDADLEDDKKSLVIFETLFKHKRSQQIESVKKLFKFKYEEKYKMLHIMLEKAFEGLVLNKAIVENSDYIPGSTFLPKNDTVRDALYQLLDNTAMYGELQLKLPDIMDRIMKQHLNWTVLIKWSIGFTNSTGLFDDKTMELIYLVAQDMDLIERSPTFVNPYRLENNVVSKNLENSSRQPPKKKKRKSNTGPRISKQMHNEL